jgi:hypothetical protein
MHWASLSLSVVVHIRKACPLSSVSLFAPELRFIFTFAVPFTFPSIVHLLLANIVFVNLLLLICAPS